MAEKLISFVFLLGTVFFLMTACGQKLDGDGMVYQSYRQISEEEAGEMTEETETLNMEKYETGTEAAGSGPVLAIEANGHVFHAVLEDNSSAEALVEKLGSETEELELHDYGSFEKVGALPWTLPRNDASITTVPGDVILYQGNQITIYYDENTWNFTRLAKIEDADRDELLSVLGEGNVTVKLRIEQSE